jgi:hypothetical protein
LSEYRSRALQNQRRRKRTYEDRLNDSDYEDGEEETNNVGRSTGLKKNKSKKGEDESGKKVGSGEENRKGKGKGKIKED